MDETKKAQIEAAKAPKLLGLHADPSKTLRVALALLPFLILICVYLIASEVRHRENPDDKVIPTLAKMAKAVELVAFTEDKRTGKYLLWEDTLASVKRLGLGIGAAAAMALLTGLNMGLFPGLRGLSLAFVTFISIVLPQIMPCLIDSTRLSLGSAWLFLIAAEAIASTDGLGYRIYLVRRYLSMDVIIPYVVWITFLGFVSDRLLQAWISMRYSWYLVSKE